MKHRDCRIIKRVVLTVFVSMILLSVSGCVDWLVPDQYPFEPLENFKTSDEALVRIYGENPFGIQIVPIHIWFVVKQEDSTTINRWEACSEFMDPYSYVRKNRFDPEAFQWNT